MKPHKPLPSADASRSGAPPTPAELDRMIVLYHKQLVKRRLNEKNDPFRQPNLVGVGVARCATTSIHRWLRRTKDVYMSPVKEIRYFTHRSIEQSARGLSFDEYLYYFAGASDEKIVGEFSPQYFGSAKACQLIQRHLGQVFILIVLRNSLRRLQSIYKHHSRFHSFKTFDAWLEAGLHNLQPDAAYPWQAPQSQLQLCFYDHHVRRWTQAFGERVKVLFYEDIVRDPAAVERDLLGFLEVGAPAKPMPHSNASPSQPLDISPALVARLRTLFAADNQALATRLGKVPAEFLDWI